MEVRERLRPTVCHKSWVAALWRRHFAWLRWSFILPIGYVTSLNPCAGRSWTKVSTISIFPSFCTTREVPGLKTICGYKRNSDFFHAWIETMMSRGDICIEISDKVVEVWCVPFTISVPCLRRSYLNVFAVLECFYVIIIVIEIQTRDCWNASSLRGFCTGECING